MHACSSAWVHMRTCVIAMWRWAHSLSLSLAVLVVSCNAASVRRKRCRRSANTQPVLWGQGLRAAATRVGLCITRFSLSLSLARGCIMVIGQSNATACACHWHDKVFTIHAHVESEFYFDLFLSEYIWKFLGADDKQNYRCLFQNFKLAYSFERTKNF